MVKHPVAARPLSIKRESMIDSLIAFWKEDRLHVREEAYRLEGERGALTDNVRSVERWRSLEQKTRWEIEGIKESITRVSERQLDRLFHRGWVAPSHDRRVDIVQRQSVGSIQTHVWYRLYTITSSTTTVLRPGCVFFSICFDDTRPHTQKKWTVGHCLGINLIQLGSF